MTTEVKEKSEEAPIELQEFLAEDCLKLDGLNDAIVGVDTKGYLVYDYQKIVDVINMLKARELTKLSLDTKVG